LDLEDDAVAAPLTMDDDPLTRWQAGFDDMFGLVAGQSRRFSPGAEPGCTC
jgi:hypothetical protein